MASVNSALDTQYDKEYAVIQLIEDAAERQAALDALNAKYNADRRAAAQEYAQLMADMVSGAADLWPTATGWSSKAGQTRRASPFGIWS